MTEQKVDQDMKEEIPCTEYHEKMRTALEQSQEVLEKACEFAGMWVFTFDMEKRIAYTNQNLQTEYGFPAEVINFPYAVFDYDFILPEYKEVYCKSFERLIQGETVVEFEIRTKLTDKGIHWLKFRGTRLSGNGSMAVCSAQIIDAEKAAEAGEANKAKSEFLARMSHDLRTPINVINGLTALTLDEADNPAAVCDNMTKMRAASDYMLGLVNDILDFARIEEGSVTFHREVYHYSDFIIELTTMFQAQCSEKGIRLTIEKAENIPPIMADKLRLKQIFFNLISNAVKYTATGGCITFQNTNIIIDQEKKKVFGEYRISDTGVGMSAEFQEYAFEPFVKGQTHVTAELQGGGLGLSIAKQLIELMGGTIAIESKMGEGTTVIVRLSFELAADDQSAHEKQNRNKAVFLEKLQGKHILLVEDHPLNAQIAKRLLEKQHMLVIYAENGKIAVDLFRSSSENTFDAILMDIRMPEMSGIDATKAIRALERTDAKSVPIIAMSANAYPKDIQKSLAAGMNDYLAKPVDSKLMYETLEKYV